MSSAARCAAPCVAYLAAPCVAYLAAPCVAYLTTSLLTPNRFSAGANTSPPATELERLSRWSSIVPDSADPAAVKQLVAQHSLSTAGVVSHGGLLRAVSFPSGDFEAALRGALAYDRCRVDQPAGGASVSCIVDKALSNLAAELCATVSGRVSAEVDSRLSRETAATVREAQVLVSMLEEMGVPRTRLLLRIAATWEGLAAVRLLELQDINCHVTQVFTLAQAATAMAAGATVVQPSVLQLQAWYAAHPNVAPPGERGTRADAGRLSAPGDEPPSDAAGRVLVAAAAAYRRSHGYTSRLMASIRGVADVSLLAGADYIMAPASIIAELAATPAVQAAGSRSPLETRAAAIAPLPLFKGGREAFDAALAAGPGQELLAAALRRTDAAAEACEAHFAKLWPPGGAF